MSDFNTELASIFPPAPTFEREMETENTLGELYQAFPWIYPEKADAILTHCHNIRSRATTFDNGKPTAGKSITSLAVCYMMGFKKIRVVIPGNKLDCEKGAEQWANVVEKFGFTCKNRVETKEKDIKWPEDQYAVCIESIKMYNARSQKKSKWGRRSGQDEIERIIVIFDEAFSGNGYGPKAMEKVAQEPLKIFLNGTNIMDIMRDREHHIHIACQLFPPRIQQYLGEIQVTTPKWLQTEATIVRNIGQDLEEIIENIENVRATSRNISGEHRNKVLIYTDEKHASLFRQRGYLELKGGSRRIFESKETDNQIMFYVCRDEEGVVKTGMTRNVDLFDRTGDCPRHIFLVFSDGYLSADDIDQIKARFYRSDKDHATIYYHDDL